MSTLGSFGPLAGAAVSATPAGAAAGALGGGGGIPSITGGMAGPATSGGEQTGFNDRNVINIAPVGTNIGEILRNFEGDPANGGFGLEARSRFLFGDQQPLQASFGLSGAQSNLILPALLLAGGAAVFFLIRRRR